MKITRMESTLYVFDQDRRMGDANSPAGRIKGSGCVVELHTDEGLTGIGLGGAACGRRCRRWLSNCLSGKIRAECRACKRMVDKHFKGGHDGLINDAISTLDMALWDLKAKANGEPLWKTLGGSKQKIHCYASDIGLPMSDADLEAWYRRMATEYGFRHAKLKVGLDQDADLRRLEMMERVFKERTDAPMLYVDANEYWSPKQAIRKVSEMEERCSIAWIEEPARRWDYLGLRRVKEGVRTAVCAGENLDTLGDFLPYFQHRAADDSGQLRHDRYLVRAADCRRGVRLRTARYARGIPGLIHAHLATVMPNFMTLEVPDPVVRDGVFTSDIEIVDGWAVLGDRPGLGLEIDREALEKGRVDAIPAGSGPGPFGRRPGAGLYEVLPTAAEQAEAAKGVSA